VEDSTAIGYVTDSMWSAEQTRLKIPPGGRDRLAGVSLLGPLTDTRNFRPELVDKITELRHIGIHLPSIT
jgi:hypothetical protein